MIDLKKEYLQKIKRIISKHFPEAEIMVFGSRLTKNHKKRSDIDIALNNEETIDPFEICSLREELMESDIPIIVDVCDLNSVSPEFKQIILSNYEILE